ncbi:MAG TPA: PQQ-binding-like beta-propeller repeat protein, partial [Gemmatimonadaceae bacterium]|nr:PQQ-binding-like beta-propeller repeat protein [Gemmatimonadaceae bacterium]
TVFFVGEFHDLVAVDKQTGMIRWAQDDGENTPQSQGRDAAIAGSVVAFGDYDIYAYDRTTGVPRWAFHPTEASAPGYLGISADDHAVYAGSPLGYLYALDAETGAARWTQRLADSTAWISHPIVSGGVVFACVTHQTVPFTGAVAALDAADGHQLWLTEFPPIDPAKEAGCYDRVTTTSDYVVATSDDGRIFAMDHASGQILWTGVANGNPAEVTAADTVVYVSSPVGTVTALHINSGAEMWQGHTDYGSIVFPVAADSRFVYAVLVGAQLFAFDARTGAVAWSDATSDAGGEYRYTPAVDVDRIYIGGVHGLYALRTSAP